jgi:hypothetical protein
MQKIQDKAMAKPKFKFVPDNVRNLVIDECAACIPTNWCDSLLVGPDASKIPMDCRGVERLLRGIQDRIRALKPGPQ